MTIKLHDRKNDNSVESDVAKGEDAVVVGGEQAVVASDDYDVVASNYLFVLHE